MQYFNLLMGNPDAIRTTQELITNNSIVDITQFFAPNFINLLTEDTLEVYQNRLQRKDFLMKHTDNTPRNMFSVPELAITEQSKLSPNFYNDNCVISFISKLVHEEIKPLPWTGERYVINGLSHSADTHGWHWDDYSYALVFIAKAPSAEQGGAVECIPNTTWNRKEPKIKEILDEKKPEIYHYESGSFYLMKSDTTLHRVAPITSGAVRIAIAMSWCTDADLAKNIDHQTVYELYGV